MYNIIDYENGIIMCSGPARFNTSTLVNSNIHQYSTWLHGFEHIACDKHRSFCTRDEYSTYNQIMILDEFTNIHFIGIPGDHIWRHHIRQITESIEIDIEYGDNCAETCSHFCCLGAYNSTA